MNVPWDPDISSLDLSPEEKNGLQVFRNYSSAFDQHRADKVMKALDARLTDISDLQRVIGHVETEEEKSLFVLACAFADDTLLAMLKREIPDGVPSGKGTLLSGFGPLARFSSRIQVCYAFGWIDAELLRELDSLRRIRNDISHKWDLSIVQEQIKRFVSSSPDPVEDAFSNSAICGPEQLYRNLDHVRRLRLRLIWVLGRLVYEAEAWVPALKAGLMPRATLYSVHRPKCLVLISDACMKASRRIAAAS